MKLMKYTLSKVLLALASIFHLGAREECHNEASTAGTHANGVVTLTLEATLATRYLLVQKGTAADGVIVNVANTRPWGVCLDEGVYDANKVTRRSVALLGCAGGTLLVRGAKAIAVGAKVYTAAAGKVTDTHATGAFFIGRAVSAAAADGDLLEIAHCFPLLDISGTTL